MSFPKISYCIFTYNEEKNIKAALESVFSQDYPKDKIEVIVVDDGSEDKTVEIVKKYPVKLFFNGKHDGDLSATIGFNNATGDFFTAVGADMQFRDKKWFRKMIKPLIENEDMAFALTKFYSHPKESLITKYINLDPIQRDLVYQFFAPNVEDMITKKCSGYFICNYSLGSIPPQTHGLYRMSVMKKIIQKQKIYYDMGNLILLIKNGYTKVGYVPDAGYYHFHAENLRHLLSKRVRNIQRSYLRYHERNSTRDNVYKWVDFQNPRDLFKLIFLIISANLFLPIFLYSLYRMIRYRNWLYILEAPITLLLVDTIIFTFLKEKNGRKLMINNLKKFLKVS